MTPSNVSVQALIQVSESQKNSSVSKPSSIFVNEESKNLKEQKDKDKQIPLLKIEQI